MLFFYILHCLKNNFRKFYAHLQKSVAGSGLASHNLVNFVKLLAFVHVQIYSVEWQRPLVFSFWPHLPVFLKIGQRFGVVLQNALLVRAQVLDILVELYSHVEICQSGVDIRVRKGIVFGYQRITYRYALRISLSVEQYCRFREPSEHAFRLDGEQRICVRHSFLVIARIYVPVDEACVEKRIAGEVFESVVECADISGGVFLELVYFSQILKHVFIVLLVFQSPVDVVQRSLSVL